MEINETQLDELIKFRDTVNTTGVVSKNKVLSLESFIGTAVITGSININKYTATDTAIYARETVDTLNNYINNTTIKQTVTFDNVIETINRCKILITRYHGLFSDLKNVDESIISNVTSEKYIYYYNGDNELLNVLDKPFLETVTCRKDYINSILITNDINNKYDNIMRIVKDIETLNGDNNIYTFTALSNIIYNNLISIIYDNHITIDIITMSNIITAIYNIDSITDMLHETYLHLDEILTDTIKYNHIYNVNKKELHSMYKRYNNLLNILEDEQSICLINIILNIFTK